jgi:hypothetical protein
MLIYMIVCTGVLPWIVLDLLQWKTQWLFTYIRSGSVSHYFPVESQKLCFSRTGFFYVENWKNSENSSILSLHSDTLFWFRANQSLLFLLNDAFLSEKQQIQILYSFVWPDRGSYPQSIALDVSTLTITLPMRFPIFILFLLKIFIQISYCPSIYYLKTKINPKQ